MNTAAVSFLSGGKCLTVPASLNGSLNSFTAVSLKQRLLVVKRLFELLRVECYQRLRGVGGLGGGVGAAALLLPYAYDRLLVDRCRAVKVSALGFTCNLADTLRLVPCFVGCPSGTLSGVRSWLRLVLSAIPFISTTPTPQIFGRDLYITPHRPRTNFHNSKGVTASVTQREAN